MFTRLICVFAAALCTLPPIARAQTFQLLYSFPGDKSTGAGPTSTLTIGPDGALYGTTPEGGVSDSGTAFRLTTDGIFSVVGNFDTPTTGKLSHARLINIGDGYLYGVTERNGGTAGDPAGTLFRLDPVGGATSAGGLSVVFQLPGGGSGPKVSQALVSGTTGVIQVLGSNPGGIWNVPLSGGDQPVATSFSDSIIGSFPYNIIRGSDGLLYGGTTGVTTGASGTNLRGTLYRVAPNGTGLIRLHECQLNTGTNPYGAMVQADDGNYYGTMDAGGANSRGCIFRLSPAGEYTVIYDLTDLSSPRGDLIQASDKFLYGTTRSGGSGGVGGVFRIRLDGTGYQQLQIFSGRNGSIPLGGLVQASDGNLYGTTSFGGANNTGALYRIKLDAPPVPQNRAPVAVGDFAVVSGDAVRIPVLNNDFDPDGDAVTVSVSQFPTAGGVVIETDGLITYTPGVNYAGSDEFTYTITDPDGKSSSAVVRIVSTAPPALVQPGIYNGLMNLDPELNGTGTRPRGQFVVVVNSLGGFTGVLTTQRKRISFRGSFEDDGTASAVLKLPGKKKGLIYLGFRGDEPGSLLGIVIGQELLTGNARPLRSSKSGDKESYTVLVDTNESTPDGYGYAIMRVLPNGLVGVAGKLGDGSKFSSGSAFVSAPDDSILIPLFSEPRPGGVFAGLLSSKNPGTQSFAGALRWIRPPVTKQSAPYAGGFDSQTIGLVSSFTTAPTLDGLLDFGTDISGTVSFAGAFLPSQYDTAFAINGKKAITDGALRSLSFNRKTGVFSGKLRVDRKTINFAGVINQEGNIGVGQFISGGVSGAVVVTP